MNSYKTLKSDGISEFTEKKSKFIAYAYPMKSEAEVLERLEYLRKKYYDATHVVYAYKLRENNMQRFSDDGEPQGTAGVPVLEIINKNELTDVLVAVVRYFGGTLLGAGGLVRAYSKSALLGIEAAEITTMCECVDFEITCSYNMLGKIQYVLNENNAVKRDILYAENITLKYYIKESELQHLKNKLTDALGGVAEISEKGISFQPV